MSGVELKPCGGTANDNILVPLGATTIGRGPFLGIGDKRVSRNHAVLEIEDGMFKVKPIHVNPTFFSKNGDAKLKPLKKNEWRELENGDRISLTPNEHIFEVVIDDRPVLSVTHSPRSSADTASPVKTPFKESPVKAVSEEEEIGGQGEAPSPTCRKLDFQVGGALEATVSRYRRGDVRLDVRKNVFSQSIVEEWNSLHDSVVVSASAFKNALLGGTFPDFNAESNESTAEEETNDRQDKQETKEAKEENDARKDENSDDNEDVSKVSETDSKEYAKPVDRKRELPAWMSNIPSDSKQEAPPVKKPTGAAKASSRANKRGADELDGEEVKPPAKKRGPPARTPKKAAPAAYEDEDDEPLAPELKRRTSSRGRQTTRVSYVDDMDIDDDGDEEFVARDDEDNGSDWGEERLGPKKKGKGKSKSPRSAGKGKRKRGRRSYSDEESSEEDVYIPKPTKRTAKILSDSQRSADGDAARSFSRRRGRGTDKENGDEKQKPCPYGSKCYRKNPLHYKEFSHPKDEDFESDSQNVDVDEDDKPECPYGVNCYRTNVEHRNQFQHPLSSMRPKRQTTRGKKTAVENGSDEDAPDTYDYEDSFLDDETPIDESQKGHKSDDCDWDLGTEENSEDINRLLKEAKGYVKNKKMQKPV